MTSTTASHFKDDPLFQSDGDFAADQVLPRAAPNPPPREVSDDDDPLEENTPSRQAGSTGPEKIPLPTSPVASEGYRTPPPPPAVPAQKATTPIATRTPTEQKGEAPRMMAALPLSWLDSHAMRHYSCVLCKNLARDGVILTSKSNEERLACRDCCKKYAVDDLVPIFKEAPAFTLAAIKELTDILANYHPSSSHLASPSPQAESPPQFVATEGAARKPLVRAKRPPVNGKVASSPETSSRHETSLNGINPNLHPASRLGQKQHSSPFQQPPASSTLSSPPRTDAIPPPRPVHIDEGLVTALEREEDSERRNVVFEEAKSLSELHKRYTAALKALKRGSTKQLKVEADEKYERQDYASAIDLYSKAIRTNDGSAKLSGLLGNRSAALFMRSRFEECIKDCLDSVKEDSSSKTKMYQRAAKAATYLGDLHRALGFHEMIDSSKIDGPLKTERERLLRGVALCDEATSKAKSNPSISEENWRMLVAEFTDTIAFRHNLAECYMSQQKYEKASETLNKVPSESRNDTTVLLLAKSFYSSGFEHFDKARDILTRQRDRTPEQQALLDKLIKVDEGKQTGNSLFSKRDFSESVTAYSTAINADLNNGRILRILYCNRAAANKELGRYKEGIEDCTKAIQLDPAFAKAYARRARCHQHLQDYALAIADFKAALKHDPQDRDLMRELRSCESAQTQEAEKEKDLYYLLGVTKSATDKEIKVKYRELSLRFHPDKCVTKSEAEKQESERKFKLIGEAYSVLSDSAKRREYDLKQASGSGGFGDRFARQNSYSDPMAQPAPRGGGGAYHDPYQQRERGGGAAGYGRFGGGQRFGHGGSQGFF